VCLEKRQRREGELIKKREREKKKRRKIEC